MKFLALQCFSCRTMQVKQAKKTRNKWSCSICNEKQSVRKVFFSSDAAKDVRNYVQQANLARGLREASGDEYFPLDAKENLPLCQSAQREALNYRQQFKPNKWERFLQREELSGDEEGKDTEDAKYVTSIPDPKPRNPRRRSCSSTEEAPECKASSAGKRSLSADAETNDYLHSVIDNETRFELRHETSEFSSRLYSSRHVATSSRSGGPDRRCSEGSSKRRYAILVGDSNPEESQIPKRDKPQYQPSKWSKYLDLEVGG